MLTSCKEQQEAKQVECCSAGELLTLEQTMTLPIMSEIFMACGTAEGHICTGIVPTSTQAYLSMEELQLTPSISKRHGLNHEVLFSHATDVIFSSSLHIKIMALSFDLRTASRDR